jgi:hypothetical protein
MDWWQLIIALFVITAYVVKQILAAQQGQPNPPAQREWVKDALKKAPATKSDEEVERDRTELDRRIEAAQERRRQVDEPPPVASPMPRRSIPMPAPPVIATPVPRYQPVLNEVPRPPRVIRTPPPVAPVIPTPAPPAPSRTVEPAVILPAVIPAKPVAPAIRQMLELLKNRETMATAIALREVLDRPLSKRRRRCT